MQTFVWPSVWLEERQDFEDRVLYVRKTLGNCVLSPLSFYTCADITECMYVSFCRIVHITRALRHRRHILHTWKVVCVSAIPKQNPQALPSAQTTTTAIAPSTWGCHGALSRIWIRITSWHTGYVCGFCVNCPPVIVSVCLDVCECVHFHTHIHMLMKHRNNAGHGICSCRVHIPKLAIRRARFFFQIGPESNMLWQHRFGHRLSHIKRRMRYHKLNKIHEIRSRWVSSKREVFSWTNGVET